MGRKWELRNSLWLILVFIILINWIAFFWIGLRAKQRKWVLFGCLYIVLCVVVPMTSVQEGIKENQMLSDSLMSAYLISWLISIIHAFLSRREYLIRRELIVTNRGAANSAYRQKIRNSHRRYQDYPQQTVPNVAGQQFVPQFTSAAQTPQRPAQKIDLNTCSEQQLAGLPGVSVALAKRAIILRAQVSGFSSVQDFCGRLGLAPHFAVQIENLAYVSADIDSDSDSNPDSDSGVSKDTSGLSRPPQPHGQPAKNKRRVVDI
jgi:DNA uptake protein ComE-like DNA-binding protein